jgi:hypothetical protein
MLCTGPMPGSASSCSTVAELRLTLPPGAPGPPRASGRRRDVRDPRGDARDSGPAWSERADALRILLATTTLALSRPRELLLAPLRIASGSRGVVRLGHGAILTVPESISEGSAWGSGP